MIFLIYFEEHFKDYLSILSLIYFDTLMNDISHYHFIWMCWLFGKLLQFWIILVDSYCVERLNINGGYFVSPIN